MSWSSKHSYTLQSACIFQVDDEIMGTEEGKWYAKTNFIEFKPGERYEYSNMGASIAGHIVEIVSGIECD